MYLRSTMMDMVQLLTSNSFTSSTFYSGHTVLFSKVENNDVMFYSRTIWGTSNCNMFDYEDGHTKALKKSATQ